MWHSDSVNRRRTDTTMAKRKRQTTQWPKEKDRQHNGQKKKTDNTMAKRKRQTTQWPKEKGQHDKQRSIKHTYKTKDRVTQTSLKTGGEPEWSGRLSSFCSTSGTRRSCSGVERIERREVLNHLMKSQHVLAWEGLKDVKC